MKEYHPPLGDRSGLRLDFNENTFACSPRVLEVLGRISRGDLTRYPEREPVERVVAEHLGVKPQQLLLTNGVDEAIHLLCQTYLDAGTEVLLPVPTYTMYEVYASGTPAQVIHVPAEDGFRFPVASVAQCDHPGDAPHRHRESQQSDRPGSHVEKICCASSKPLHTLRCWWTRRTSISSARRSSTSSGTGQM